LFRKLQSADEMASIGTEIIAARNQVFINVSTMYQRAAQEQNFSRSNRATFAKGLNRAAS
jgi:hypothetical protein